MARSWPRGFAKSRLENSVQMSVVVVTTIGPRRMVIVASFEPIHDELCKRPEDRI